MLGQLTCDRSCLLHRFVKNEWRVLSSQTIGVEFASKIIKVGTGARRKRIKLQVGPDRAQIPYSPAGLTNRYHVALGYGRHRKISVGFKIILPRSRRRHLGLRHYVTFIL
jgi:hypothetical protein